MRHKVPASLHITEPSLRVKLVPHEQTRIKRIQLAHVRAIKRLCHRRSLAANCSNDRLNDSSNAKDTTESGRPSQSPERSGSVDETLTSLEAMLQQTDKENEDSCLERTLQTATVSSLPETDARTQLPQEVEVVVGPAQKEQEALQKLFDGTKPILQELRETPPQLLFEYAKKTAVQQVRDYLKPTHIVDENFVLPRVKPRVAYLILVLNIAVYLFGLSLRLTEGEDGPIRYFNSLANINAGIEGGEYYRLITSNFLHDSFVHLAVSSYALFTIAPEAEALLGVLAFLTTYTLGGVAGAALCFLVTDTVTVGASTGIFGLIGAMGSFLYKNHRAPQASDQVLFAIGTLLFNLFLGGNHETTVDNLGHLGGLVCGVYLGYLLTPLIVTETVTKDSSDIVTDSTSEHSEKQTTQTGNVFPVDLQQAAKLNQTKGPKMSPGGESSVSQNIQGVPDLEGESNTQLRVYQPNPLQSLVILFCVSLTLGSGVAATVLHRTGELPVPHWPIF